MARQRKTVDSASDLVTRSLDPVRSLKVVGRLVRRSGKRPGSPPGTLVHTGNRKLESVRLRAFRYDESDVREEEWTEIPADLSPPESGSGVLWVNVDGLHDVEPLARIAESMKIHPLAMEDVANVGQRPKIEEYAEHLFVVAHMLRLDDATGTVEDEQISFILGPGYLFTFQESPGDVFEPVRERIRDGKGRIRARGCDYLAYALIDALVDSHFAVLEKLGERAEGLETEVIEDDSDDAFRRVYELRRELLVLRRSIWPLRDMLAAFARVDSTLVEDTTKIFLRDVLDHSYQLIDTLEVLREINSGTRDLYLTSVSNRTNEVMKVLTIMASLFIPLTFIAGIYGMNFEAMPELGWRWGYPAVWIVMIAATLGMLWYFKRKRWI